MKITDRFVGDHKTFRKLIKDINQIAGQTPEEWDQKRLVRLVELFKDHMILHAWGEETFYYPVVASRLPERGPLINKAYMAQMDEEHRIVDSRLSLLEKQAKSTPISEEWTETYLTFITALAAHMDREETELFPFSEGLLGKEGLEQISVELEKHRREAPSVRRHASFT